MGKQSKLLLDSNEMITLQTQLACIVGDRAAIALQQIHYWCDVSQRQAKREHYQDDQWWVYNTWSEWQKNNFPFWSISTVRRVFHDLEELGVLITRQHDERNKGFWVTINYGVLEDLAKADGRKIKVRRLAKANNARSVQNEQPPPVQNEQTSLPKMNRPSVQNEQATREAHGGETTRERDTERGSAPPDKTHLSLTMSEAIDKTADSAYQPIDNHTGAMMQADVFIRVFEGACKAWGAPQTIQRTRANKRIAAQWYADGYTADEIRSAVNALFDAKKPAAFAFLGEKLAQMRSQKKPALLNRAIPEIGYDPNDQPVDYDPLTRWMPDDQKRALGLMQ